MRPPLAGTGTETGTSATDEGGKRGHGGPDALSLGLALLVLFGAILAALAGGLLLQASTRPSVEGYRTETVTRGRVTGVLEVPARVIPRTTVRVGAGRVGRTTAVLAAPGDRVKRGQVLARLDDREHRAMAAGAQAASLAAQVSARQAQMRLAQIVHVLQRGGGVLDQDGELVSPATIRAATLDAEITLVTAAAELKRQEAAVTTSRLLVSGAALTSPIDGMVLSRDVEPGETVAAGAPLFVIAADPSELQVVATLEESAVGRVRPGPVSFVVSAFPGEVFPANIGAIEPDSGDGTGGYRIRLRASNPELHLRPGMSATVSLPLDSPREALHVPLEALGFTLDGAAPDRDAVYVLDGARRPRRVPVQRGVSDGRVIEVRSAQLEPGASVILGKRPRLD